MDVIMLDSSEFFGMRNTNESCLTIKQNGFFCVVFFHQSSFDYLDFYSFGSLTKDS